MAGLLWAGQAYVAFLAIALPLGRRLVLRRIADGTAPFSWSLSEAYRAKLALTLDRDRWYPMAWPRSTLFGAFALVVPRLAGVHPFVVPFYSLLFASAIALHAWRVATGRLVVPGDAYRYGGSPVVRFGVLVVPHGFVIWGRLGPYPL